MPPRRCCGGCAGVRRPVTEAAPLPCLPCAGRAALCAAMKARTSRSRSAAAASSRARAAASTAAGSAASPCEGVLPGAGAETSAAAGAAAPANRMWRGGTGAKDRAAASPGIAVASSCAAPATAAGRPLPANPSPTRRLAAASPAMRSAGAAAGGARFRMNTGRGSCAAATASPPCRRGWGPRGEGVSSAQSPSSSAAVASVRWRAPVPASSRGDGPDNPATPCSKKVPSARRAAASSFVW